MKNMPILLLAAALSNFCMADMGSIPFKRGVRITEPKQDAIIAWNGKEQLLYLQTTLAASEPTKVLEVMPLPNKPSVEASEEGVFKRCVSLLPRVIVRDSGAGPFGGGTPPPAAQIVERKLIGAHDLRVVELLNAKDFTGWVAKEISQGGQGIEVPEPLLTAIGHYAADGYRWFIFDVVDLEKEHAKKTPLRIRFATDHLYYPMRITRTEKGMTTVSLSIITNVLFNKEDCVGIPRSSIEVDMKPVDILGEQIRWIDPPLYELLGRPKVAKLRSWRISGEIDTFEKDLLIRNPATAKREGLQGVDGKPLTAPKPPR